MRSLNLIPHEVLFKQEPNRIIVRTQFQFWDLALSQHSRKNAKTIKTTLRSLRRHSLQCHYFWCIVQRCMMNFCVVVNTWQDSYRLFFCVCARRAVEAEVYKWLRCFVQLIKINTKWSLINSSAFNIELIKSRWWDCVLIIDIASLVV